eukprot:scaffold103457_cov60-Phaeocystis_antarctica.AAC.1
MRQLQRSRQHPTALVLVLVLVLLAGKHRPSAASTAGHHTAVNSAWVTRAAEIVVDGYLSGRLKLGASGLVRQLLGGLAAREGQRLSTHRARRERPGQVDRADVIVAAAGWRVALQHYLEGRRVLLLQPRAQRHRFEPGERAGRRQPQPLAVHSEAELWPEARAHVAAAAPVRVRGGGLTDGGHAHHLPLELLREDLVRANHAALAHKRSQLGPGERGHQLMPPRARRLRVGRGGSGWGAAAQGGLWHGAAVRRCGLVRRVKQAQVA